MKNPPIPFKARKFQGFALIVTLVLMVLLTILALGLLSLSAISLRASSRQQLTQEARQNARLALMMAIGELQTATGPDQRITAPADIRSETLAQPHLTGVWQGWKWDGVGTAPKFSEKKQSQFLRWLVSSREPTAVMSPDFASAKTSGEQTALVKGSATAGNDRVDAQIIPIASSLKERRHGYAWAVFDESTKLPVALPEPGKKSATGSVALMSAAPLPGYSATTKRDWKSLTTAANDRQKLVTPGETALTSIAPADRGFHDITSSTSGVLADAGKGGLAVDLSRLFNGTALPTTYASRYLYSDTDTPLVGAPTRFSGANPFPSPDPSWKLLRSHYRLFDKLTGGLTPMIDTTSDTRPPAGTTGAAAQGSDFFNNQQIAPVIAKAQFVFSIGFGWHGGLTAATSANNSTLPVDQRDQYVTWLVVDPVITIWNPYNVNVRFTGSRIDLYRVPLTFRLYKNGTLINPEYTHLANTFLSGADFTGRGGTYYRLNLLPDEGKSEFILAPGEHVVFTAVNHVKHFNHEFSEVGLNLRRGFSPPAGNSSKSTVGGTSTLNVCVGPTGQPTGTDYGKPVRTIAVKANDRIQVEVKPGRGNVDKPAETGNKEISGYLKYYVGPPSNQRLVGGIELDYGTEDSTHLPSYPKEDLPTIVVSDSIPKSPAQADVYLGLTPPVVRFKEPFLVSTFQLKTERNSKFPSRSWLNNSPVNLYASEGLDQREPWSAHQYELQWESMTDWPPTSPGIEISNTLNHGYGGSGIYFQSGVEYATHSAIPLAPALSVPQLRHAPLNVGGQLPLTSQIVANSFASPLIDLASIRSQADTRTLLDHSYFANSALFDHYFFSGLADPGGTLDKTPDVRTAITDFFDKRTPLPNPRFTPRQGGRKTTEIADSLTSSDGYLKTAAHLLIDSPFNVNSTRVDVWEAFLASTFGSDVPLMKTGSFATATGDDVAVARQLPTNGNSMETSSDPVANDVAKWNGHRRLTKAQIRRLAEEIVVEVRARGPFQSMAEFVNRRPETGPLGQTGALQAAIQRSNLNQAALNTRFNVVDSTGTGNTADGSPGVLNQADLLTPIAPVLAVRGDTFRIRAYGEAGAGTEAKVKVWCEAVVQRVPEYIDSSEQPWITPMSSNNIRFGRHYEMISFRWLSPSEI